MINRHFLISISAFLFLLPSTLFAEVELGKTAPNFTATDSDGTTHSLQDFKGKIVVLEWTNPLCPYVEKHYDTRNMQSLQKKYTGQNVVWLTINSSADGKQGSMTATEANSYIREQDTHQTAYLFDRDGKIGRLYGAKATPHMYVIDTKGKLVYMGAIDNNSSSRHSTVKGAKNFVSAALESLIQGDEIEVAATDAYGCSVKYAN
jgi:peroxiredoxin